MIYLCCDDTRREMVRAHPTLTGIDHLEVVDGGEMPPAVRQRTLMVQLVDDGTSAFPVKDTYAAALDASNVVIQGGERVRGVKVTKVAVDPASPRLLVVTVDQPGDFTTLSV